jgi:succinate-semialdehyde dehydrogenase/glutarate-semialdehyde dehydrogenase
VKISQQTPGIQAMLENVFQGFAQVRFHAGKGAVFLNAMLSDKDVEFIQVFGDDSWIGQYEARIRASSKTLAFEGPGKDPLVVLEGADLQKAVDGAIVSGLFAGGAACMSTERYLVHRSLARPFVTALVKKLSRIQPEPPDRPESVLGYMYSGRAAVRLRQQVKEAVVGGARLVLGGDIQTVDFAGRQWHACAPMVLTDVPAGAPVVMEETFGPVFPVQTFDTEMEAIELANSTPYGLTATVLGPDSRAAVVAHQLRESHAMVYTNTIMPDAFEPDMWGCGGFKRSGWLWETLPDGTFRQRTGLRTLRDELSRIAAGRREASR